MKSRVISGLLVTFVVLSLGVTGCVETQWKATGGGWGINAEDGSRITIGFNAQPTGDGGAEGQLQLVNFGTRPPTRVDGTFLSVGMVGEENVDRSGLFYGECSVNGVEGYTFALSVGDSIPPEELRGVLEELDDYLDGLDHPLDLVVIEVYAPESDDDPEYVYFFYLQGGNITVHADR